MEEFIENTRIFFNSGDPEIRTFYLVRNNYLPFILCSSYVMFSTIIGPAIMKNRKPFGLRNILIAFNFFLVAAYIILITGYFWNLTNVDGYDFCKKGVLKKGTAAYKIVRLLWWMYILKYIEFLDTIFFILRKKENLVTFLHVFHHTIVPILGWVLFRTETNGMHSIPGIINACVHVVMYTYYGLAAVGPKFQKYLWWKKYLTQLQMIQFLTIVAFEIVIGPVSGCSMSKSGRTMAFTFAPLFFYLFYKFYKTAFSENSTSSNGVARKPSDTNGTVQKSGGKINTNRVPDGRMKKEE